MPRNEPPNEAAKNPNQLTGWKEIAAYLDKAPRTVQRWESVLGLPVHRIRVQGNETIFAFKSEVDAWRARIEARQLADGSDGSDATGDSADDPCDSVDGADASGVSMSDPVDPPRDRRRRVAKTAVWTLATIGLVALSVLWIAGTKSFSSPDDRAPARWTVDKRGLHVFNGAGSELWSKSFEVELAAQAYAPSVDPAWPPSIQIRDIDGDGRQEVLLVTRLTSVDPSTALHCFDSEGVERWVHQVTRTVNYGSHGSVAPLRPHNPPFISMGLWVLDVGTRAPEVWASARHHQEFPSVLQRIDPAGHVLQEYWSNGEIWTLTSGVLGGQRRYFVGGVKNEDRQASLAVFDSGGPRGVAPAEDPYYVCRDCGTGQPLMAFAFPRSDVARVYGGFPVVDSVGVRDNDVWVNVRQNGGHETDDHLPFLSAAATYHVDSTLRLIGAEFQTQYEAFHRRLEKSGAFDHPFDRGHERELWPVGRWDGWRWLAIPGPEIPGR